MPPRSESFAGEIFDLSELRGGFEAGGIVIRSLM